VAVRGADSYTICLLAGMAFGPVCGEWFFSEFQSVLGEPWLDIAMGLGGAALGGIIHEIVTSLVRRR